MQRFRLILALIISMLSSFEASMASTLEDRKEAIMKMETYTPSDEQIQRKARSESILKAENVPYIEHLPVIDCRVRSLIYDSPKAKLYPNKVAGEMYVDIFRILQLKVYAQKSFVDKLYRL